MCVVVCVSVSIASMLQYFSCRPLFDVHSVSIPKFVISVVCCDRHLRLPKAPNAATKLNDIRFREPPKTWLRIGATCATWRLLLEQKHIVARNASTIFVCRAKARYLVHVPFHITQFQRRIFHFAHSIHATSPHSITVLLNHVLNYALTCSITHSLTHSIVVAPN